MKNIDIPVQIRLASAIAFLGISTAAHAVTTVVSPNVYEVNEGVAFTLGNTGASDFTFNWTDPGVGGASFSNVADPTLILTVEETYTFQRATSAHPFVIMDASAASFITGTDGSYARTTTDGALIDAATLSPIADFTADPAPTSDLISWTPTEVGDFWYTCQVTGHTGMTGAITVVPEPSAAGLLMGGVAALALVCRRRKS